MSHLHIPPTLSSYLQKTDIISSDALESLDFSHRTASGMYIPISTMRYSVSTRVRISRYKLHELLMYRRLSTTNEMTFPTIPPLPMMGRMMP